MLDFDHAYRKQYGRPKRRTFIEQALRDQILQHAIEIIASLGYGQACLARIADRAGISKGVISYHFPCKEEMIRSVADAIYAEGVDFMRPQVQEEASTATQLSRHITSNIEFIRSNPDHLRDLVELAMGARPEERTTIQGDSRLILAEDARVY